MRDLFKRVTNLDQFVGYSHINFALTLGTHTVGDANATLGHVRLTRRVGGLQMHHPASNITRRKRLLCVTHSLDDFRVTLTRVRCNLKTIRH